MTFALAQRFQRQHPKVVSVVHPAIGKLRLQPPDGLQQVGGCDGLPTSRVRRLENRILESTAQADPLIGTERARNADSPPQRAL